MWCTWELINNNKSNPLIMTVQRSLIMIFLGHSWEVVIRPKMPFFTLTINTSMDLLQILTPE
ncbi:subtilisin-like protease sbt5.3 [Phtheirospermum japonicum]|uniref:Subtilisin-like protease sbt5.3 n=1 Tax=Phtheirospermum japonicum TaxID=374723 RepID=A0A830DIN4_9LAMI|nr:subtilisin-like protease sbt5.3 [Phtheirospermum japonicum]